VLAESVRQPDEADGGPLGVAITGPLEEVGHLRPAAGGRQQVGERLHGLGVVAVVGEHALPGADRGVAVADRVALDVGDLDQIGAPLHRRGGAQRAQVEGGDELGPAAGALEQADAGVQRRQVGGVSVDAALPERERAVGLVERLGEASRLAEHRAAGRVALLERGQALEDVEALARLLGAAVELGQPAAHDELLAAAGAVLREGGPVQLDGARRIVEQIDAGAGGLGQQLDPARRRLRGAGGSGHALGVAREVVRALGELAQLLLGHGRVGHQRQQRGVVIHRRLVVVELGEASAGLLAQRAAAGRIEGDDPLEDADDLARATGRVVVSAQQIEGGVAHRSLAVRRLDDALEQRTGLAIVLGVAEQRSHRGQGARRVAHVVEPARRDAGAGPLALLARLALEPALPERDQVGPPLVALEEPLEALAELLVLGGQRQQTLQVADGLVGEVRDVLGQLRRLAQEADAAPGVLGRLEGAIVEPQQIAPALALGVEHAEPLQRRLRLRRQLEHAGEDALEHVGLVAEPLVAEVRGALADHLGDLRLGPGLQHVAIERDDVVGLVVGGSESFDFIPRSGGVRSTANGASGVFQIGTIGHETLGRRSSGAHSAATASPETSMRRTMRTRGGRT
jgi:hypothetical protein